jgi:AP-4 complex subunit sigma-1
LLLFRGVACFDLLVTVAVYCFAEQKMIKFVLMVNKQGQTRLASYFEWFPLQERVALEAEIIRRCLSRTEYQCSFIEYRGYKVVYRRYASLFFVVAVDSDDDNELSLLEFIHSLVETMDKYFESVCELDVSGSFYSSLCHLSLPLSSFFV